MGNRELNKVVRLDGIRPLVRYVDEDQAVIDTHFSILPTLPGDHDSLVEVQLQINGADGFEDEGRTKLQLVNGSGSVRFNIVRPQRWWPASLGAQPLYELTISLASRDQLKDQRTITLGLTSVRRAPEDDILLVNGQILDIESVVCVDVVNERKLLPVTGGSLLLVRGHYGEEVLYDAADRAGILLVQCIPIDGEGTAEQDVRMEINRLSVHPSLAGWFVGHLGRISDQVAQLIRGLDPTRTVFRTLGEFPTTPLL